MSRDFQEFVAKSDELIKAGKCFVSVSLVSIEAHVPQNLGARAIFDTDGLVWGTVGGGRLEAAAQHYSNEMLAQNDQRVVSKYYDLQRDLGMVCGGTATLLFELVGGKRWNIVVFGAGHVAQALVPLLATLDCQIIQIDSRPEWLERVGNFSNLKKICAPNPAEQVSSLPNDAYFVLMTQGHATDLPIAQAILKRGLPPYLGVIGSVVKARNLKSKLMQDGVHSSWVERVNCPIGLDIGSNRPAEIAISIAAQLIQVRDRSDDKIQS
jgi:xanthine dehydrogenase accessory factor